MLTIIMSVDRYCRPCAPFNREGLPKTGIILQGRKTYEEYGPVPDRQNVIFGTGGMSLAEVEYCSREVEIYCIGGIQTFQALMPLAQYAIVEQYWGQSLSIAPPIFSIYDWISTEVKHYGWYTTYRFDNRQSRQNCIG